MSTHRLIWDKAIHANKILQIDKEKGKVLFENLINKYPNDGMVAYEQGEGYELLGEYAKAIISYKRSYVLFPLAHWKKIAEIAYKRADIKLRNKKYVCDDDSYSMQWDAFHKMHSCVWFPDKVRLQSLSAITRIDSEIETALAIFRTTIEKVLSDIIINNAFDNEYNLEAMINFLSVNKKFKSETITSINNIRKIGNYAIHDKLNTTIDIPRILSDYISAMIELNKIYAEEYEA